MANATGPVAVAVTQWGDDKIVIPLTDTAATFYPGAMIARIGATGYGTKCDDTAALEFVGINAESQNVVVFSGESSGDRSVLVKRPWRFAMNIASAAMGQEGDAVYAKYDNEVAYAAGVTNLILVGWVDEVLSSTRVLINPTYGPLTNLTVANNTLTFDGASGANTIVIPDNLAEALVIKQGANAYLTFESTDTTEEIISSKKFRVIDSAKVSFGDADDITMAWDGTDFDVLQATANSSIKWGIDGAGIDHVFYGDTASTNMTWDQSADALIFSGACRVTFTGTTGQAEMRLTDNLADALSVGIASGVDLLVLTTTDTAESVAVRGLRTTQTTAVAVTGATTLTLADSGGVFMVDQDAAFDIDLPSPTSGPGCTYTFVITDAGTNDVTVTVAGGAATFVGSITIDGATIPATGSTLTFANGAAGVGDSIVVRSLATNLYHVVAIGSGAGAITIA